MKTDIYGGKMNLEKDTCMYLKRYTMGQRINQNKGCL